MIICRILIRKSWQLVFKLENLLDDWKFTYIFFIVKNLLWIFGQKRFTMIRYQVFDSRWYIWKKHRFFLYDLLSLILPLQYLQKTLIRQTSTILLLFSMNFRYSTKHVVNSLKKRLKKFSHGRFSWCKSKIPKIVSGNSKLLTDRLVLLYILKNSPSTIQVYPASANFASLFHIFAQWF